jgi:hypothetical protein
VDFPKLTRRVLFTSRALFIGAEFGIKTTAEAIAAATQITAEVNERNYHILLQYTQTLTD